MIENIKSPSDIKHLTNKETEALAAEIRETIIGTVSTNGGHLASNLGMVEATIALHRVFDSPSDKIIFDVGHQCYTHKLLTGRFEAFSTLRRLGGLSGFTSPAESAHDALYEGHSGTSVSAALGIASANKLNKNGHYTVAVVGDGSLTNGMFYEALNNCGEKELDLIILINDNEMSISPNVGGLHNYLTRIRTSNGYFNFKRKFENCLSAIPVIGWPLARGLKLIKDGIKRLFIKDTIFEDLGLIYLGPVDGHDVEKLTDVLTEAKNKHRCCVVHMLTEKGRGYRPAEEEPDKYHSVGIFDADEGVCTDGSGDSFSSRVGDILCDIAKRDEKLCAITAAMCDGTGLTRFASEYPERFFDVGIAEEHAVTFAGGLAAAGMKPIVALYSTFAQRVYDQLLHDVSIQGLPLVLLLDRCGIVPGDGITHQGIFDYPMFSSIPGVTVYAPECYDELEWAINEALNKRQLAVIRYPKGGERANCAADTVFAQAETGGFSYTEGISDCEAAIITYGRLTQMACGAAKRLCGKHPVGVIRLKRIYPLDAAELDALTQKNKLVFILEESIRSGGVGEKLAAELAGAGGTRRVYIHAVNGYIPHGDVSELMKLQGFDEEQIVCTIESELNKC
ncbi:MAG: 1-deoxy-D-xylulose-5-phosphate synthase [Clostridia bacterium]|nr:1-deoxy-D-xylulose-5-phosphate synthase [Clostridia bacterium]